MKDIDNLISDYLAGTTTKDEDRELCEWIEKDSENLAYFSSAKAIHSYMSELNQVPAENGFAVRSPRKHITVYAAAAGIATLLLGCGYLLWLWPDDRDLITYENSTPATISIGLPDSSSVWLSPGSRISYKPQKFLKSRNMALEGEAVFDIAKNPDSPFTVSSPDIMVKVLGTVFNITDYPGDNIACATLAEGNILMQDTDGKDIIRLMPGQQATYDERTGTVDIEHAEISDMLALRDGIVCMENACIEEIKSRIEKDFGIKLNIASSSPQDTEFTITYLRDTELDSILDLVETVSGYRLEVID